MRTRWLALVAVTLSSWLVARALAADPIPEPVLGKLLEHDAAFLKKALAKGKLTDKMERKVKAVALMIAAYAQSKGGKADAAETALRDRALALIKAVEDKKMPEAKALAAKLSLSVKPEPGGRMAVVPLHTHLKFEYLMRLYSGEVIGGFGMERDMEDLVAQKGNLTGEQKDKALALAYKIAIISQLAQTYPPPDNTKKKEWLTFGKNTHNAAMELASAVKTGQNIGPVADKLSLSCTKCHDVFKN
jgi:hypothetical protein